MWAAGQSSVRVCYFPFWICCRAENEPARSICPPPPEYEEAGQPGSRILLVGGRPAYADACACVLLLEGRYCRACLGKGRGIGGWLSVDSRGLYFLVTW